MKILLLIVLVLLAVILIFLMYLLLSPVKIILDSRRMYAMLGWNRWLSAEVLKLDHKWGIQFTITFWKKYVSFRDMKFPGRKKKKIKTKKKKKTFSLGWRKIIRLLKTIKIREFKWLLDTDDYILNAYLTPFFEAFSYHSKHSAYINFTGKNVLKLNAEGRVMNMLIVGMF